MSCHITKFRDNLDRDKINSNSDLQFIRLQITSDGIYRLVRRNRNISSLYLNHCRGRLIYDYLLIIRRKFHAFITLLLLYYISFLRYVFSRKYLFEIISNLLSSLKISIIIFCIYKNL